MKRFIRVSTAFEMAIFALMIAGCSQNPADAPAEPVAVVEEEVVEEVEVPAVASNEVTEAMATLSEADRAAALAQKICPVSNEPLGSMGAPIKLTVGGRDVFICCDGCRKELEENPDKYLAKLGGPKLDSANLETAQPE